jgi:hypothetical protein
VGGGGGVGQKCTRTQGRPKSLPTPLLPQPCLSGGDKSGPWEGRGESHIGQVLGDDPCGKEEAGGGGGVKRIGKKRSIEMHKYIHNNPSVEILTRRRQ